MNYSSQYQAITIGLTRTELYTEEHNRLATVAKALATRTAITFELPNGMLAPSHYPVTEVGQASKNFIDYGSTVRGEQV